MRPLRYTSATLGVVLPLSMLVVSGCDSDWTVQRPPNGEERDGSIAVAWIDGTPILLDDLRLSASADLDFEFRKASVEAAIRGRLVSDESRRLGLDRDPGVATALNSIRRDADARERLILRAALIREFGDSLRFSDSDLATHFDTHRESYQKRVYRLRRLDYATREEAQAAKAALETGERETVRFSTEAEEIGPVSVDELPPEIRREVSLVYASGVVVVVPQRETWSMIEIVEVGFADADTFTEVRAAIRTSLVQDHVQRELESMLRSRRRTREIRIDEAILADDSAWKRSWRTETTDARLRSRRRARVQAEGT